MKIEEARKIYSTQIQSYREQHMLLSKQKQELDKKISSVENGKELFAEEAATLELTIQAVDDKQAEYQAYMEDLMEQWSAKANMVVAEQQGEAMEKYAKDMVKIMEVARRLMKGAIVPYQDEKRLMEYSMELYQAAKNMGAIAQQKEKEKYDSLWDEEDEGMPECEDPIETANNTEVVEAGPEIVDVADAIASAMSNM